MSDNQRKDEDDSIYGAFKPVVQTFGAVLAIAVLIFAWNAVTNPHKIGQWYQQLQAGFKDPIR